MALAYAAAHPKRVANLAPIDSVGTDLSTQVARRRVGHFTAKHRYPAEPRLPHRIARRAEESHPADVLENLKSQPASFALILDVSTSKS